MRKILRADYYTARLGDAIQKVRFYNKEWKGVRPLSIFPYERNVANIKLSYKNSYSNQ